MLNPFFLNGSKTEQNLIQDLVNEQLRMYGVEIFYLPRTYVTKNTVIREVIQSEFNSAYPIEAYVENYDGYSGQGTILSKFGIQNLDDLTLIISRERYENYIAPLVRDQPNIELTARPKEGDLIYFPLGDRIFEIKYVEHEQPFYQLQKNYVYQLRCELFRYEDEVIDTGIESIDDDIAQIGYIQTLTMIGAGKTATATASICASGSVQKIYINNMGGSYTSLPVIGISSAPDGETTAVGIASITNSYVNCNGQIGGKLEAINLVNSGCGYTVAPWITIQGGGGVGAAATAGITTGAVQIVTVTDGGSGYTTNPPVTATPSNGASFVSNINSAGVVTSIYISNSGSGFSTSPTITIGSPIGIGTGVGVGTYVFNEVVTGETSGVTARVKTWTKSTNVLEVSIIDGTFTPGEVIVGSKSNARYGILEQNTDDLVTPFADNDNIELEADKILDFSETNPFGMP